jgi:hypothetical protein
MEMAVAAVSHYGEILKSEGWRYRLASWVPTNDIIIVVVVD